MCFPRSSVINEISLALWALVCGGLWAAAAAIAPLKEESSPKQSKRDWINEAEDKRVELSWRSGASQIKNEINLLMEWLIGVACSAPEAKWSPTLSLSSTAPPTPSFLAVAGKAKERMELGCWGVRERGRSTKPTTNNKRKAIPTIFDWWGWLSLFLLGVMGRSPSAAEDSSIDFIIHSINLTSSLPWVILH